MKKRIKYFILIRVLRWVRGQMQFGHNDDTLLWQEIKDWQVINDPGRSKNTGRVSDDFIKDCRAFREILLLKK